ncbi:leukocyte immunoglobulin-like receptor subfamily A member 4 [Erpetoichthys calabaricus]|uniref:leukocyte immunoglobulin-like receptor subfamily A member 4 n=1 Tax=Erpetoichthys calabaricus TaxID=27687 RepID=UPI002234CCCE|nr:leukocyte immunoglobulin-like receptor subfamily A member 4 [Erpetoichthys calabaricus]
MQAFELSLIVSLISVTSFAQDPVPIKTTLILKAPQERVYIGDTVTLECNVEDTVNTWIFRWFINNQQFRGHTDQNTQIIQFVNSSYNGVYTCDAYRRDTRAHSLSSNAVLLVVQERSTTLKVISGRRGGEIYVGDEVQLLCLLDGDPLGWRYELQKTGDENSNKTQRAQSFTIKPVSLSHSGEYKCRASKGELHTDFSDPIQLHLKDFSLQNYLRLGAAGLVLIVLAIIMSKCFWNRVLPAGDSSGYAYTSGQRGSESYLNL